MLARQVLRRNPILTRNRRFTTAPPDPPKKKGLLYRMAPPKGGTELPDAKFLAIASVVCVAGYYAWFVDPPKER